ncbi:SpaA isopeptide-forming pilin-related protein, partial [Ruminococcus flavefaciens]|uniref:SpaA isopeptide-forming pilin-related protein n=1 Tax=Ruminococcus flavefaciens TaxID=1265 RepID=UPI00056AA723
MKKSLGKRFISGVTSGILAVTYALPASLLPAAAEDGTSNPKYGKDYAVEDILSEYAYFIKDDANIGNHTVGSIAVGGTGVIDHFGEGAVSPSFIGNIEKTGNYQSEAPFLYGEDIRERYKGQPVYYHEHSEGLSYLDFEGSKFQKIDNDFIDFNEAFAKISEWSESKKNASDAYRLTADDVEDRELWYGNNIKVISIDFDTMPSNIVIPKDIFESADLISLNGDIAKIATGGYTITLEGIDKANLTFDGNTEGGFKQVEFAGVDSGKNTTAFHALGDSAITQNGQINLDAGMNFVWNFPDSSEVNFKFGGGHIVAPNASYSNDGGNNEGSIIAKSIAFTKAEAHFYPYFPLSGERPEKKKTSDVSFSKVKDTTEITETTADGYSVKNAGEKISGAHMVLTLDTPDKEGETLSGVTSNLDSRSVEDGKPAISDKVIKWTTTDTDLTLKGLPDGKYILSEENAPDGCQPIKSTVITVSEGKVTSDNTSGVIIKDKSGSAPASLAVVDEVYTVFIRKARTVSEGVDTPVSGAVLRLSGVDEYDQPIDMSNVSAKDIQYFTDNGHGIQLGGVDSQLAAYKLASNSIENIAADKKASYEFRTIGSTVAFTGLPAGTYTIEELSAPAGFLSAASKTFVVSKDSDGRLAMTSGRDADASQDIVTLYDNVQLIKISKADIGGKIVEGAEFELSRTDNNFLGNVSVAAENDEAYDRIIELQADDSDGDDYNDKGVEIQLNGTQSFTVRGNTMNHISINGKAVNAVNKQNTYLYESSASGNLIISGMYEGDYTVELDDGTGFILRCDKGEKEISEITVFCAPKSSDNKDDLKDSTAILSSDKKTISFKGGTVDIASLEDGEYVLKETAAPNGFAKVESEFTFEIKNGEVTLKSADTTGFTVKDGNNIIITDSVSEISIYKYYDSVGNTTPEDTSEGADMKLTFVKASDKAAQEIIDARNLKVGESAKWNSKRENPRKFIGLMDGEYLLEEVKAPDGYQAAEPKTIIIRDGVIAGDGTTEFLLNTKKGTITLDKKALGGEYIADGTAEFTIKPNGNGATLKGVSINGSEDLGDVAEYKFSGLTSTFRGLVDGDYILVEDTAPAGYSVVSEFRFTVKGGKVENVESATNGRSYKDDKGNIVVEDAPIIKLSKESLGAKPIPESAGKAEFTLIANDEGASLKGVKINGTEVTEDTNETKFKGNAVDFEYLGAGSYTLVEDTAPTGYSVVTKFNFTVDEKGRVSNVETTTNGKSYIGENGEIVVEDAPIIKIDKKEVGGEPIPEESGKAKFKLTAEGEQTLEGVKVDGGEAIGKGVKEVEFDGNTAELEYLPDGKYSLEETAAPDGYTTITTFTFEIEDGVVKNTSVVTDGDKKVSDDGKTIEVFDTKSTIKIDKQALGGTPIPESAGKAKFTLIANDEGATLQGVKVNGKTVEDDTASVEFDGNAAEFEFLKDGQYTLREDTAPTGYSVITDFTFTVENGVVTKSDAVTTGRITVSPDGKKIVVEDAPIIKIDKKEVGGEPIPESAGKAKFKLTAEGDQTLEGVKVDGGEAIGKGVKEVEFDGNAAELEYLPNGTYSLEETAAPDGYTTITTFTFDIVDGTVTNVKVKTDGDAKVSEDGTVLEVFDTKSVISIDKKALGGEEIPAEAGGATFVLTAEDEGTTLEGVTINDGKALGEVKSTEFTGNGTKFTGLKDGKYSLEETAAPTGFKTVTKFTFDIENGVVKNVDVETDGDAVVSKDGKVLEVFDTKSVISIDKKALGGEEIPAEAGGATFVLTAEDKDTTLEGVTIN